MDYLSKYYGFYRVSAGIPKVKPADPYYNKDQIFKLILQAESEGSKIIVFPELSISGYTCGDLFNQNILVDTCLAATIDLCNQTKGLSITVIIGLPLQFKDSLYNCAAIINNGHIIGIIPKLHIPNYSEFYEKRWFKSGINIKSETIEIEGMKIPFGSDIIFKTADGIKFGIEICEDLWVPESPSMKFTVAGAEIVFNLSATDEILGKHQYLRSLIAMTSAKCRCCYVYSSAGSYESSTDLVFAGNTIMAEDGKIICESERFNRHNTIITTDFDIEKIRHDRISFNSFNDIITDSEYQIVEIPTGGNKESVRNQVSSKTLLRSVDPLPFVPQDKEHLKENCEEIISIQSWGLEQRLLATNCKALVIGISGGLDSTLALLIACHAFDRLKLSRKKIFGITMPGEATSSRTFNNATALMKELDVKCIEIPIGKAVAQHFNDIEHNPSLHDATYENSQARERTQILMDMANKVGGMVLGTGDLSELALGWCTYNGDQMSMYGINASVPKTLIRHLVNWFAETTSSDIEKKTLLDIIDTPISPELIPAEKKDSIEQKTEDLVGPYELHDFFLYHTLRHGSRPSKIYMLAQKAFADKYNNETIKKWLMNFYRRFFSQQFKRSCMPDGPKVGSVCLSPRGDWRMPSDISPRLWLNEVENL